ncbi:nuclear transport factor 2 family protein [Kitasatospora sp. NPDC059722]|uniref:nuclear transport factor 2 family protein n=1 Tax=unclassified Kitasatospora TaxID=2633591 RepID=UPI00364B3E4B
MNQQLDARTVVTAYVTAIAGGDLDTAVACFADDATWEYPGTLPLSRVWRGKEAIFSEFLVGARALFAPDTPLEVTLTQVLADGPKALAEWTSKGTAANGSAYENHCAAVFTVENGLITAVREYLDTDHVARTLFA